MIMTFRLFDTMSRELREVKPSDGENYRFYCCGPTVYGPAHIGNFRTFVIQDVFRRILELQGMRCTHVRNLTDVDDKTIRDSQKAGVTLGDFTRKWTEVFHKDCEALNLLEPHIEPSAVEHIPEQIELITTLIEKGNAYQGADGSVYFKLESMPNYGRLSRVQEREMKVGAAVDHDEYEKDQVADFVLWKARKEEDGDNYWESPWGEGRPGWHLECSAMAMKYLGENIDFHGGGEDLKFPHHDNEIAQSECATGKPFCNHWSHGSFLQVEREKMAKSKANFYTIPQLKDLGYSPVEVRYELLSRHYRQQLNFTMESLKGKRPALQRLARFEAALAEKAGIPAPALDDLKGLTNQGSFGPAWESLLDDMNVPEALGRVFTAIKQVDVDALDPETAKVEYRGFHFILQAIGFEVSVEEETAQEIPEEIEALAQARWDAKQSKDWAKSDELRDQIQAQGWVIKDAPDGYELEKG